MLTRMGSFSPNQNDNLYGDSKIYWRIVSIIKLGIKITMILIVSVIAIAMIYSVNAGQFGFTLVLTVIFLIVATLMNRVVDHYGD
jgi:hypothetical protein